MIVHCAILSYLSMHPGRGCSHGGMRGWGRRMGWHPCGPLRHKKRSICPPQFDAVICHASNNLGVWHRRGLFKLLQDELLMNFSTIQFWQYFLSCLYLIFSKLVFCSAGIKIWSVGSCFFVNLCSVYVFFLVKTQSFWYVLCVQLILDNWQLSFPRSKAC